ncbi:uncharacterized protein TNCV_4384341 [Trichonephila clavipes]|nr:uncharacterized protein TNCV_4384341 [Trichonephila clavipes]
MFFNGLRGRGSLVVKITDSWPVCYELELSTTEDPPCRGTMHIKSVKAKRPPVDVVWKLGGGVPELKYRPRHLTVVQNYDIRCKTPSCS